jgi:hypothetical protein
VLRRFFVVGSAASLKDFSRTVGPALLQCTTLDPTEEITLKVVSEFEYGFATQEGNMVRLYLSLSLCHPAKECVCECVSFDVFLGGLVFSSHPPVLYGNFRPNFFSSACVVSSDGFKSNAAHSSRRSEHVVKGISLSLSLSLSLSFANTLELCSMTSFSYETLFPCLIVDLCMVRLSLSFFLPSVLSLDPSKTMGTCSRRSRRSANPLFHAHTEDTLGCETSHGGDYYGGEGASYL